MNDEMNHASGQELGAEVRSRIGGSSMENLVIVAALVGWFVLMRWVLPRMGVPT